MGPNAEIELAGYDTKGYDTKDAQQQEVYEVSSEEGSNGGLSPEKAGTAYDQRDMSRVGKLQELRVRDTVYVDLLKTNLFSHRGIFASSRSLASPLY